MTSVIYDYNPNSATLAPYKNPPGLLAQERAARKLRHAVRDAVRKANARRARECTPDLVALSIIDTARQLTPAQLLVLADVNQTLLKMYRH
jgi:hypothetical protein